VAIFVVIHVTHIRLRLLKLFAPYYNSGSSIKKATFCARPVQTIKKARRNKLQASPRRIHAKKANCVADAVNFAKVAAWYFVNGLIVNGDKSAADL
jgi:hypothetical protein